MNRKDGPAARTLTAALLRLNEDGERTPCAWLGATGPWVSEDPDERALAVPLCRPCPVRAQCHAAAVESRASFGVWAGKDHTRRQGKGER